MTDQNGRSLALRDQALAPAGALSDEQLALISQTIAADTRLNRQEMQLFAAVCSRTGLDPFLREIHVFRSQGRLCIHVGIMGRRLIAHRTGLVDGTDGPYWCGDDGEWHDVWLSDDPPRAAKFTVYRKGASKPFTAVAHMKEFKRQSPNWQQAPDHQIAKVAEDHAWRKAFPREVGTLPTYQPEQDESEQPEPEGDDGDYREIAQDDGPTPEQLKRIEAAKAEMDAAMAESEPQAEAYVDPETGEIHESAPEPPAQPATRNPGSRAARTEYTLDELRAFRDRQEYPGNIRALCETFYAGYARQFPRTRASLPHPTEDGMAHLVWLIELTDKLEKWLAEHPEAAGARR